MLATIISCISWRPTQAPRPAQWMVVGTYPNIYLLLFRRRRWRRRRFNPRIGFGLNAVSQILYFSGTARRLNAFCQTVWSSGRAWRGYGFLGHALLRGFFRKNDMQKFYHFDFRGGHQNGGNSGRRVSLIVNQPFTLRDSKMPLI